MTASRTFPALVAVLALSGCAVGPDFQKPAPPAVSRITAAPLATATVSTDTPGGARQVLIIGGDVPAEWWVLFKSPVLEGLVREALRANPSLAAAKAALRVADANAAAERASFFPGLDAGFAASRQKSSNALSPVLANSAQTFNLFTPQLTVSYAPDLFGGVRRGVESAEANARAQKFSLRAAHLALASNVALAAIQFASLSDQIGAQQKIVADAVQLRAMLEGQVVRGGASRATLAAQDVLVQQAQAALLVLQKQWAQQRNLLAALTGKLPAQFEAPVLGLADLSLPKDVPVFLPADLVRQRPDVRIAEENLHVANAQVGVAIAAMLPGINLSATGGSAATAIGALFGPGNGFWNVGAGLLQPLFDGGALRAKKRAADAALDQAKAQYQSAVITAFENTADALEAIHADAELLSVDAGAESDAASALARANRQKELGDIGMPGVLLAEQNSQQAQLSLIQARASRYADMVGLFAALGGGWWNREPEQAEKG